MREVIEIPVESLPEFGLRRNSQSGYALHRYPDPDPRDPTPPIPACVAQEEAGAPLSENPGDYIKSKLSLAADTRRYSLCSRESCFGRLKAVRGVTWDLAAKGDYSLNRIRE